MLRATILFILFGGACTECPKPATAKGRSTHEQALAERAATNAFADTPEGRLDLTANAIVNALKKSDGKALYELFGPAMRDALPLSQTEEFVSRVVKARGSVRSHERLELRGRTAIYRLIAHEGEWRMSLVLNSQHDIAGLEFNEPPNPPPPVARTAPLRLPFRGEWSVAWGGDNEADNVHINHNNQRRAADLYVEGEDGRTHRGEGGSNADYYAYGREILSAGKGSVVAVIDGVPDNTPGSMNGYFALGNAVIVKHSDEEFALYAHLQPGTIPLRVGQAVRPGTPIGRCGNSGNSSEPHLHFHVQDTSAVQDGWGIDPVFSGVLLIRNGKKSTPDEYTFRKGDRISQRE